MMELVYEVSIMGAPLGGECLLCSALFRIDM
jgi:hypothetical protein